MKAEALVSRAALMAATTRAQVRAVLEVVSIAAAEVLSTGVPQHIPGLGLLKRRTRKGRTLRHPDGHLMEIGPTASVSLIPTTNLRQKPTVAVLGLVEESA